MQWWELLDKWQLPHARRQGITLVARQDAETCLSRIAAEGCRFYGYDALTLLPDGRVQIHLDLSPEWQPELAPAPEALLTAIRRHPPVVTHYEFVFISESDTHGRCAFAA